MVYKSCYSRNRACLNKLHVLLMYIGECPSLHGEVIRSICAGVQLWHFNLVTYLQQRFSLKLRGVTRFCGQGILPAAKYSEVVAVQGEVVISGQLIFKWCRTFASSSDNMMDENRIGRRSSSKTEFHTACADELTQTDRYLTLGRKTFNLRLFYVTAQHVVLDELQCSEGLYRNGASCLSRVQRRGKKDRLFNFSSSLCCTGKQLPASRLHCC